MEHAFNSATSMDGAFDMAPELMSLILDNDDPAVPVLAMCLTLGVFANQFESEDVVEMICNSVREAFFNAESMMQSTTDQFSKAIN